MLAGTGPPAAMQGSPTPPVAGYLFRHVGRVAHRQARHRHPSDPRGQAGRDRVHIGGGTETFLACADTDLPEQQEVPVIGQRSARTVEITPFSTPGPLRPTGRQPQGRWQKARSSVSLPRWFRCLRSMTVNQSGRPQRTRRPAASGQGRSGAQPGRTRRCSAPCGRPSRMGGGKLRVETRAKESQGG